MAERVRRMFRPLLIAGLMAATPALALDLTAMTEAEREQFRAEVRAYLLENPEVLMEAIGVLEQRKQDAQASADEMLLEQHHAAIFEDPSSWVGGNPDGDVTVVEFLDYKCGYCKQAHPEVTKLLQDDGNVRYVVKEFPILGPQSDLAARFAVSVLRVAGDDAYAKVHDALMAFRGEVSAASLRSLSERLDLDTDAVMAGMDASETTAVIDANHALAQALEINGTPGFVFEHGIVRGYVPYESLVALVAEMRG